MKLTDKIPELKPQNIEILQHAGNSSKDEVIIMRNCLENVNVWLGIQSIQNTAGFSSEKQTLHSREFWEG